MQIQAYNVHSILKQGVRIETLAAYDKNVILGTDSGQLIMYSVDDNSSVDMLMFSKNFSKKPIVQMEIIPAENLLFVLTDGMIQVCDISRFDNNFAHIHSSVLTKGCVLFAVDANTSKSSDEGETATGITVCCAFKKHLEMFFWKVDKLYRIESIRIELKDTPKALKLIDNFVCVGFKDQYVLYNIHSQTVEKHDLFKPTTQSLEPCICVLKKNLIGVFKDEFLVVADVGKYQHRNDQPPKRGTIEDVEVAADLEKLLKPLQFSSTVLGFVWDDPYIISRLSNGIEVRCFEGNSINKETLVQIIPELSKTKFLVRSDNGLIFAASRTELWCIRMADIPTQRQQLIQQKQFQLAIELTRIAGEPEEIKLETIRQIHMRYARELFCNKQFPEAMKEFELASADAYDVIRLFPNLLPEKSTTKGDSSDAAAQMPLQNMPELKEKDLENGLLALTDFLIATRGKIKNSKKSSKLLLSIIATTLLKCYLQTNDSCVEPLLRLNEVHLEEAEKTLKKYNKMAELVILYQKNNKHREALELLKSQAFVKGSRLFGHQRTISYLQQLGSTHLTLIFEFANWVLKEYPEDGLKIFTSNYLEVENLPRAKVLDYLLIHHKPLAIPYLEHIIFEWQDTSTLMHKYLIQQYREKVQNLMETLEKNTTENSEENNKQLKIYRTKLYDFLKNSKNYAPELVLQDFPTNMLLEERVLILGRLKKHEKVLAVYIQILGNVEKAFEYCEENCEDDAEIFLTLLNIIMNPPKQPPYEGLKLHPDFIQPNEDVIVTLLNKYPHKLDPKKVIPNLPDEMPAHKIQYYLETVLRKQMAEKHKTQILEGLLHAEILRLQAAIKIEENKCVEITENTICPDCNKRFTSQSAFVRYPSGEVVHLSCYTRKIQSINQAT